MKIIYVNNKTLQEAVDYLNDEITFFGFISHAKHFLKQLLLSPSTADIDEYLKKHGLDRKELLNLFIEKGVVEKETKIENKGDKDKFILTYKIPKQNFERKLRRIYISLFEKNEISESITLKETDCGGVMQAGGSNPDSGQYTTPLGKVQRRKIYLTKEQSDFLKETATHDAGNYQYDVPLNLTDKNDPTLNHNNMIANGIPNKKKGIRKKTK
jgi:hypothetical protein